MTLTPKDEDKINLLKEKYELSQTTELVRFLINHTAEMVSKEQKNEIHP
jgi:hypothetical protein